MGKIVTIQAPPEECSESASTHQTLQSEAVDALHLTLKLRCFYVCKGYPRRVIQTRQKAIRGQRHPAMESQTRWDTGRQYHPFPDSLQEETFSESPHCTRSVLCRAACKIRTLCVLFQGISWKFILGALVVALSSLVTSVILTARNWNPPPPILFQRISIR